MNTEPPPLPSSRRSFFVQLARGSWMSVIIACGANVMIQTAGGHPAPPTTVLVSAILVCVLGLLGVGAGIAALFGIPRHGRKGLLWPAVTGLGLWILLLALAAPAVLRARSLAGRMAVPLRPAIHAPAATRVRDEAIGFAFDLPEGYAPFTAATRPPGYSHAFLRQGQNESNRVLLVKPLGGVLSARRLRLEQLPGGKGVSLTEFDWRGVAVDGIRVPEKVGEADYVTLNVQIPLRKQAIQLSFGGPAAAEADTRALVEQVLGTLEGESSR